MSLTIALATSFARNNDAEVDQLHKEHSEGDPEPKLDLLGSIVRFVKIVGYLASIDLSVLISASLKDVEVL